MRILAICLCWLALGWLGCNQETLDTTLPTLTFTSLSPEPQPADVCGVVEDSVFLLTGGTTFQLDLLLQDNIALSQLKVDIHNNFDCHGHGGAAAPGVPAPGVSNQTEDWSVLLIQDLSGTEESKDLALVVPANVTAGNYHFQVQVLDAAGNDQPLANIYELQVTHPDDEQAPVISVSEPANSSFVVNKGATIQFSGTVTDNYSLSAGGNGLLFLSYTDLSSGNTFTTNVFQSWDASVDQEYNFNLSYTVPSTLVAGAYRFTLRAHDGVRNVAIPVNFSVTIES